MPRTKKTTSSPPTAISLFSGAGGLDLGVEEAGFEVRAAVEIDAYAADTLEVNKWLGRSTVPEFRRWFETTGSHHYRSWPEEARERVRERIERGVGKHLRHHACAVMKADIRAVPSAELAARAGVRRGELALLFGGPPCQSFSRAGQRQAVDDERGQLFTQFVRIATDLRPRWIMFENVKGLIQTKAAVWRTTCSRCEAECTPPFDPDATMPLAGTEAVPCEKCGSPATTWSVEKAKRGGSLDWIQSAFERAGYTTKVFLVNAADCGVPQRRERVFILGSRDNETSDLLPFPQADRESTVWETLFSAPNPDHAWPLDPAKAVLWVKNVVRPHDEPVTWSLLQAAPTVGAHQGAKLAIAPNGVPEAQLQRQQWHVLGRRQGDTRPVPVEHTYLSDRDLLLLQTFPEYWWLSGTRMERAFQIGNAVPPALARHVAASLLAAAPWVSQAKHAVSSPDTRRKGAAQQPLFGAVQA